MNSNGAQKGDGAKLESADHATVVHQETPLYSQWGMPSDADSPPTDIGLYSPPEQLSTAVELAQTKRRLHRARMPTYADAERHSRTWTIFRINLLLGSRQADTGRAGVIPSESVYYICMPQSELDILQNLVFLGGFEPYVSSPPPPGDFMSPHRPTCG